MTSRQLTELARAEQIVESIARTLRNHPRAAAKLHTALDYMRAAWILGNEGEQASVGHQDDPQPVEAAQ